MHLFTSEQILEGMMLLPAVGFKISLICGEDPSVAKTFSKQHEGSIRKIHWQILVLLHQLTHSAQLLRRIRVKLKNSHLVASVFALEKI